MESEYRYKVNAGAVCLYSTCDVRTLGNPDIIWMRLALQENYQFREFELWNRAKVEQAIADYPQWAIQYVMEQNKIVIISSPIPDFSWCLVVDARDVIEETS